VSALFLVHAPVGADPRVRPPCGAHFQACTRGSGDPHRNRTRTDTEADDPPHFPRCRRCPHRRFCIGAIPPLRAPAARSKWPNDQGRPMCSLCPQYLNLFYIPFVSSCLRGKSIREATHPLQSPLHSSVVASPPDAIYRPDCRYSSPTILSAATASPKDPLTFALPAMHSFRCANSAFQLVSSPGHSQIVVSGGPICGSIR
jgi:hypothetical protein